MQKLAETRREVMEAPSPAVVVMLRKHLVLRVHHAPTMEVNAAMQKRVETRTQVEVPSLVEPAMLRSQRALRAPRAATMEQSAVLHIRAGTRMEVVTLLPAAVAM